MTNTDTELYELCKQVYEATGWKDTEQYLWLDDSHHNTHPEWDTIERSSHDMGGKGTPLYTSDYLLEKLPSRLIFHNNDCAIEVRRTKKDKYMWSANIRHSYGQYFKQISDTPLKALLKLTLKLHEEKIL